MSSIYDQFGSANPTGNRPKYEFFNVGEGEKALPPLRIFPAMHSLRERGVWAFYIRQHYGYAGVDPMDKTKKKMKPFLCIEQQNRQTKMVEVSCPECRNIEEQTRLLNDRIQAATGMLKQKGILNEKEIEAHLVNDPTLKPLREWLQAHNLDKKYAINVMSPDGKFGVLRIGYKSKQALDEKIKELRAQGLEPIADLTKGVYFNFRRSGKGRDTLHTVDVTKEVKEIDGERYERMKFAPVSEDQAKKALETLPDLTMITRVLTAQQIKLLVESSGDPEEVDVIIGMANNKERSPARTDAASVLPQANLPVQAPPSAPAPQQAPPPPPVVMAPPPPAAPVQAPPAAPVANPAIDQIAALQAQLAALMKNATAPVAPPAPPVVSAPVVTPPALKIDPLDPNISPQDFAAAFPPPPRR
jgi:hypothetical protein